MRLDLSNRGFSLVEMMIAIAVGAIMMAMMGHVMKGGDGVYHVGVQGNRILFALAELVIGWRLVVNAAVALGKQADAKGDDVAFYAGKVAAARFYCGQILPGIGLARRLVEASELSLMSVDDAAF